MTSEELLRAILRLGDQIAACPLCRMLPRAMPPEYPDGEGPLPGTHVCQRHSRIAATIVRDALERRFRLGG